MKKKRLSYFFIAAALLVTSVFIVRCTKSATSEQQLTPANKLAVTNSGIQALAITTFVHPGILNTTSSLNFIANEANNTSTGRYNDYNNTVLAYCNSHSVPSTFPTVVDVAGGVGTPDEGRFKGDGLLAYALALRWAKTGTATYATQVKQILDGWANNFQSISPVSGTSFSQTYLEAAWAAPNFVAAAEIIKYYVPANGQGGGWTSTEDTKFKTFINKLKDTYINHVADMHYNNNWDISAGYAKMAIGIFLDSPNVYENGLTIIKTQIPLNIDATGKMKELCDRDCHHPQYSLTGLSYAANMAVIQNNDLSVYTANESRLLAGYEYLKNSYNGQGCRTCAVSSTPIWPGIEIANRRYHTAGTQSLRNMGAPYSLPGQDISFLGFTTYTHYNVP
ncbi:alginate lyase family protein [Mucilaginibacter sp.]|uniref:alginate lyase family protein n=1 Tax=Mucilaginibacter sp. TaxID=1882438 RepID=UPI0035624491